MKKGVFVIALVAVLMFSMPVSASAMGMRGWGLGNTNQTNVAGVGYGYGMCGFGYDSMWNADGTFVDGTTFEARLDDAISNGWLAFRVRDGHLNMYDWCATYGADGLGVRGLGCGRRGGAMWYYTP